MSRGSSMATKFNLLSISLVLLTTSGVVVYQSLRDRHEDERELLARGMSVAAVIAANSVSGVHAETRESLDALSASAFADPAVMYAALLDREKKPISVRRRRPGTPIAPAGLPRERDKFGDAQYANFRGPGAEDALLDILTPLRSPPNAGPTTPRIDAASPGRPAYLQVGLDLAGLRTRTPESLVAGALSILCAGLIGSVATLLVTRKILQPVQVLERTARQMAMEDGGPACRFEVASRGEIRRLADSLNHLLETVGERLGRARRDVSGLTGEAEGLGLAARKIRIATAEHSRRLAASSKGIHGISRAITEIDETTERFASRAEQSASVADQVESSIREVFLQTEHLFEAVSDVSTTLHQMSAVGQQLAADTQILSSNTETTAASTQQLDASIQEIRQSALRTQEFSEKAARDAERGKGAVEQTIHGIEAMEDSVKRASETIRALGEEASDIDKIVRVINEVADQTGLLALNAAIIAAQAGEHGKGFAVVAGEIGSLAERTALSTDEISGIIQNLQSKSRKATAAIEEGSRIVREEATRSRAAGDALEKILASATSSRQQVLSIVRATEEQAESSHQIADSVAQGAALLQQIAAAMQQQSEGVQELARAADNMGRIAAQVRMNMGDQASGSALVGATVGEFRGMAQQIAEAAREQKRGIQQLIVELADLCANAESTLDQTVRAEDTASSLLRRARALVGETESPLTETPRPGRLPTSRESPS